MKKISLDLIKDFHTTVQVALGMLTDLPSPKTDTQWAVIREVSRIPSLVVARNRARGGFDAAWAATMVANARVSIRRKLSGEAAEAAASLLEDLTDRLLEG